MHKAQENNNKPLKWLQMNNNVYRENGHRKRNIW